MRILLISHGAGPYGAERVLLALADGFAARGHEVLVEFPHPGPTAEAAARYREFTTRVANRHRLPRDVGEGIRYFWHSLGDVAAVRRTIREADPDLVWINSLYNPWAALAARLEGRPVVWHLHEYRLREPLGIGVAVLVGLVADQVAVVSEYLARGWGRYPWLRRRLVALVNPLIKDLGANPKPPLPFTVGYVGQLEPRKRVPVLVRAMALVPDARCVVVGDGKARVAVEAAVMESGIADRVELVGYCPDVAAQLARFHCLAVPSVREPFGLVALEAMAAGVPVVAARSGALPEVLGDAAAYHPPGDVKALAREIRSLKEDEARRLALRDRGFDRVRRFRPADWIRNAEVVARDSLSGGAGD